MIAVVVKAHKVLRRGLSLDSRVAAGFLLPSVAGFLVFYVVPFFWGGYYSLVDSPIHGSFVGLRNYFSLLASPVFRLAMGNTLLFGAICLPLIVLLSLCLALALSTAMPLGDLYRGVFLTPLVVPVACVALVWQLLFDTWGGLNALLAKLGVGAVDWLGSGWARAVVLVVYVWRNLGYGMVIMLAGLQGIPKEYLEAASIEGAGAWRRFWQVTFVYLAPATFFVVVISITNSFKVFRETYLLAGEYPDRSIYMLQHYMNNTFRNLDYQKLTSAAIIVAVMIYVLVALLFWVERKISKAIGW